MSAGDGSGRQVVSGEQVENPLTAAAAADGEGELRPGTPPNPLNQPSDYLSNPDTSRYLPSQTQTTRAPLWPSGPGPS